jgi:hypothetical protein
VRLGLDIRDPALGSLLVVFRFEPHLHLRLEHCSVEVKIVLEGEALD